MNNQPKDNFWQKALIGLSVLFFLQIIAPFSKPGLFLGHDSQLHLIYLKHFEETFRQGQIPVRMIDWFVPGLNQPLFNFYQPGVNYLFLIPRFIGLNLTTSLEVMITSLWLLSGLLMFLFAKRHFGTLGGILVSYMYVLAPYHILDVLIRSALPEFTALAFIPGVFWALKGYFDTRRGLYLTLISIFIALVTISHPPTIIMYSPFIVLYVVYELYVEKSWRIFLPVITSFIVGFGLISFFLLPGLLEQKYVRTVYMRTGYYDFRHHFVCPIQLFKPYWSHGTSREGCNDLISFQLGLVHWLVVGSALTILLVKKFGKDKRSAVPNLIDLANIDGRKSAFLAICLGMLTIYVYMMFEISEPIWETLPYIPFIQYSWRFLAPTIFVSSLCAGFVLLIFKKEEVKYVVFIILMVATGFAYKNYLKPIAYADPQEINFGNEILHESVTGIKALTPEPGYMPRWTQILPAENDRPESEVKVATEEAKVDNYKLTTTKKTYQIIVEEPTVAHFYTHYFPGWEVTVDGQKVDPAFDNIYGYMDVPLNPGDHKVVLTFKNTKTRTFANALSVNFLIVAIGLAFVFNRKKIGPNNPA